MKKNSVEIRAAISKATDRCKEIINLAKTEVRELTDEEEVEIKELKDEIETKKIELKELEDKIKEYESLLPEEEEEQEEEKNNKRNKMKKNNTSFITELRNAMNANKKTFEFNANTETRAVTVTGEGGVHDEVVETEILGLLEPLYADSLFTKLGVRWITGYPMGDVQIAKLGKGTCGWKGEIETAGSAGYTFDSVKMHPRRLTVQVPISKMLIAQDNIQAEASIRKDIVKAMYDKLQETIFGTEAGTDDKPAGIFYGVTPTEIADFKGLCEFESELDDANIGSDRKYLLGNGAKSALRSMIKGTNATGMVMEGGEVDGTPAYNASNIAGGKSGKYNLVVGDWYNLAIAMWSNLEVTYDDITLAADGQIRLILNAYFDAAILRPEAFAFGTVDVE